jgi:hypothetical protein
MRSRVLLVALPLLALATSAVAAPVASKAPAASMPSADALRIARLGHLVRLWGAVRYLHPYLAYKDIDWDAAFTSAVLKVREAKGRDEYAAAAAGMLAALGDPMTRVVPPVPQAPPATVAPTGPAARPPLSRWAADGILVIDLGSYQGYSAYTELPAAASGLRPELAKARAVIFDLRTERDADGDPVDYSLALDPLAPFLVGEVVRAPPERFVVHSGYVTQRGVSSGGYSSYFATPFAATYAPDAAKPGGSSAPRRVVFLLNGAAAVPPLALALQAAGEGAIVSEGELDLEAVVRQTRIDLGEGLTARVRTGELVPIARWPGPHADAALPARAEGARGARAGDDPGIAAAMALAESQPPAERPAAPAPPLPDAVFRPDRTYAEMRAPGLPHRLLAVARLWNVIDLFYPYKPLIDDWDAALPAMIAVMERADGAREYALAVAEMSTRVADNHVYVYGHPELDRLFGTAGPPITVRRIEGVPVVIAAGDEAKKAGVEVGDVVQAVDGEPAAARFTRLAHYVAASTPQGLDEKVFLAFFLAGADGSTARLLLAGRDGRPREARVRREAAWRRFITPATSGEVVRILPRADGEPGGVGDVGYVDLTRLTELEVDGMFERLAKTRAIVLDMRGYPKGTSWSIAPRINIRKARCGALFRRPEVSALVPVAADVALSFCQTIDTTDRPLYRGKTVMLIDERAISQSEHSGLLFEAASATTFVGTPTAGANGDVATLSLPGGIFMSFSGHEVRHADGRQLQRVGLVPDVAAAPTIAGLRAGRDEVLERALRYLDSDAAPAAPTNPAKSAPPRH